MNPKTGGGIFISQDGNSFSYALTQCGSLQYSNYHCDDVDTGVTVGGPYNPNISIQAYIYHLPKTINGVFHNNVYQYYITNRYNYVGSR